MHGQKLHPVLQASDPVETHELTNILDLKERKGTDLGLWEKEKCTHQRYKGNAAKDPSDTEVDMLQHVRDDEVSYERPDDIPGCPDRLRLLSNSRVGDFSTK